MGKTRSWQAMVYIVCLNLPRQSFRRREKISMDLTFYNSKEMFSRTDAGVAARRRSEKRWSENT